jgi:four helix bundle protein
MSKPQPDNQSTSKNSNVKIRSYLFSVSVIRLLNKFPVNRLFNIIIAQLIRSVTSIGANIYEAKSSSSKRDFIKFYTIALKSANESRYWFSILRDTSDILRNDVKEQLRECEEITKMLAASLLTAKKKRS